jgi:hypothetical protein
MSYTILVDKDGKVDGVVRMDEVFDSRNYPLAKYHIDVDKEMATLIAEYGSILRWNGSAFVKPSLESEIWTRIKENRWGTKDALKYHEKIKTADLSKFEVDEQQVPKSAELLPVKAYSPYPTLPVTLLPGVTYRFSTEDDYPVWEQQLLLSKEYTKDTAWAKVMFWISDPWTWALVTEENGVIIQLEVFTFTPNDKMAVQGGFAAHVDRTRPREFWTSISRYIFEALDRLRFEYIDSTVQARYAEYIRYLKEAYGGKTFTPSNSKYVPVRTNIKVALANIPPNRLTLGKDWLWTNGEIVVRELQPSELATVVYPCLKEQWGDSLRKYYVYQVLNKRYYMDHATIIGSFIDGKAVSLYYWLKSPVSTGKILFGVLTPVFWRTAGSAVIDNETLEAKKKIATEGFYVWALALGYKKTVTYIEKRLYIQNEKMFIERGYILVEAVEFEDATEEMVGLENDIQRILDGIKRADK